MNPQILNVQTFLKHPISHSFHHFTPHQPSKPKQRKNPLPSSLLLATLLLQAGNHSANPSTQPIHNHTPKLRQLLIHQNQHIALKASKQLLQKGDSSLAILLPILRARLSKDPKIRAQALLLHKQLPPKLSQLLQTTEEPQNSFNTHAPRKPP